MLCITLQLSLIFFIQKPNITLFGLIFLQPIYQIKQHKNRQKTLKTLTGVKHLT